MGEMQQITTCFFDMDGVLVDTENIWIDAICMALDKRGFHADRQEIAAIEYGRAWPEIFRDIQTRWPDAYSSKEEMQAVTVPFFEKVSADRDMVIHPSVELLQKLDRQGLAIGIVSGSSRSRIQSVINKLGISRNLKAFIGCEDCKKGKPAPDCYLEAAELFGVKPCQCLVFEDSTAGVAAATAAGMKCAALVNPGAPQQDLSSAAVILQDLMDFDLALLDN